MTYNPSDNSAKCYDLALASLREINIRRGSILPRQDHPDELRWAVEGDRPVRDLDTVKGRRG